MMVMLTVMMVTEAENDGDTDTEDGRDDSDGGDRG